MPLGGSKTAEIVLLYVTEFASNYGSRIVLTRVCEPNMMVFICRSYLEEVAERIEGEIYDVWTGHKCVLRHLDNGNMEIGHERRVCKVHSLANLT